MGMVQLPDDLQRVIDQQVAEGRAVSSTALLQEAVMRLVEETHAEEDAIREAAEAGLADIEAGSYTTVATLEDAQHVEQRLLNRLRSRIAAER